MRTLSRGLQERPGPGANLMAEGVVLTLLPPPLWLPSSFLVPSPGSTNLHCQTFLEEVRVDRCPGSHMRPWAWA